MNLQNRSSYLLGLAWPALLSLTPGVSASGQVYMTRAQALSRAFPAAHAFLERRHVLSKKEKAILEKKVQRRLSERGYLTWLALDAKDKPLGFVIMTAEVGRTEPFFLMLAMDCQGQLQHLDVLEYREPRGSEVRHQSFLRRFKGVDLANSARKLRRVPVIPGATLSCHAVSRAVKKCLVLHEIYLTQASEKEASKRLVSVFRKAKAKRVTVKKKKALGNLERSSMGIPAMGDVAFVELETPVSAPRIREVLSIVKEIEDQLSPRIPTSLVGRANSLKIGERLALADWPLASLALQAAWVGAQDTSCRFSPVPSRMHPDLAFCFEEQGRVLRRVGTGDLDPGGFGKGFAADLLGAALDTAGISWTVAGFRSSFLIAGPAGQRMGISTSGTKRRGAHIRDPRTGSLIETHGEIQVTASTALEAEFWSTAQFVEQCPRSNT